MRRFLTSIFLFVLFLFAFYAIAIVIWGTQTHANLQPNLNYRFGTRGHMHSRLAEAKHARDVDILFLGSSHAYRGFDPRIFEEAGIQVFNLGSSAQTPLQTEVLLDRYLDRMNPRLIVYEVFPLTFELDGVESSFDVIANDRNDFNSVEMAVRVHNVKVYNTLVYGFMRDLLRLDAAFVQPRRRGKDAYVSGGFVERTVEFYRSAEWSPRTWKFDAGQLEAFSRTVAGIRESNIELLLVNAPITSNAYRSFTNNDVFDSMMAEVGTYYNFNEIVVLDDSLHFFDWDHLNQNGVEIFNKRLIEVIRQGGHLETDPREHATKDRGST